MAKKPLIVHILVGLPGSGKSCFAQQMGKQHDVLVFDENGLQDKDHRLYKLRSTKRFQPMSKESLFKTLNGGYLNSWARTIVLDGLFLTNDLILDILDFITNEAKCTLNSVVLHIWNEDKAECKRNDLNRRRCGSALSIDALSIQVDPKAIKEKYPMTRVQRHTVYHSPDYAVFFRNFVDLPDESRMESDTWSIGGTCWNYEGVHSPIDPDPTPSGFPEMVSLLRSVWPDIPYLIWEDIKSKAVSTETFDEADCYSHITKQKYVCDMALLYDLLQEHGWNPETCTNLLSDEEESAMEVLVGKPESELTTVERAAKTMYLAYYKKG